MASYIDKALIGNDGGVKTVFHFDPDDMKTRISYHEDVSDTLDENHLLRVDGQRDIGFGRKVASIPPTVYMEWCRLSGVRVQDFMRWNRKEKVAFLKKFLNDPDWYKFKTVEGRV